MPRIYSEALALGAKAGLTPQVFDSVIRGGRMDCPFYQTFSQYVVGRDPNAHRFAIRNALKDLTYLAAFANASGTANPISGGGAQFLRARRQCRPGRALRADAVRFHRRIERRIAGARIGSSRAGGVAFPVGEVYMQRVDISADRSECPRFLAFADVYPQNLDTSGQTSIEADLKKRSKLRNTRNGIWNGQVVQQHQGFRFHPA